MATRTQYRTMQGKTVDLQQIIAKNELTPAVGNARVNARGDELGPGGIILRKREEVMADYYRNTGNSLPDSMPNRKKTSTATVHHQAAMPDTHPIVNTAPAPQPIVESVPAVNDLSPNELDFNDPEDKIIEPPKRKRTTQ